MFTHTRALRFLCKCGYEKNCQNQKEADLIIKLHKKICSTAAAGSGKMNNHTLFSRHDGQKGHELIDKDREDSYENLRFKRSGV